jgi:DNA-binding transcriptional ArsR family regulator
MGHGVEGRDRPVARLDAEAAAHVATTLQALATPSRLLILTELRQGPRPVTELAEAVGMEQSAVSHQLRLLRNLGLVTGARTGRSIVYSLYDNHVAQLLDEAVYHSEHLRLGLADRPEATGWPAASSRNRP